MKLKLTLLFVLLFIFSFSYAYNNDGNIIQKTQNNQKSLKEVLNPDGTINTSVVLNGSFNPQGYKMIAEPGQVPRFIPIDSTQGRLAGDQYWSNPFSFSSFPASSSISAIVAYGSSLFVGGSFTNVGNVAGTNNIAKWTGTQWVALGTGTDANVNALAIIGTNLYVGGSFLNAGGISAPRIAMWSMSTLTWSGLLTGVTSASSSVQALAVSGTNLYVGGKFTQVGGIGASNVAMWNGTAFSALGTGVLNTGVVKSLAVSGTSLYVGGNFATAGGVTVNNIAKWSGSAWTALSTGTNNWVYALTVSGTNLYAGGQFTLAGGIANTSYIAKWSGTAWSALGTGLNGPAYAIESTPTAVYVGGFFTTAGGITVNRIAKWDLSAWSAYGSGLNNNVLALEFSGSLYAGGSFTDAGGDLNADYLTYWGNSNWMSLPYGINATVSCVTVDGTDIYVGGSFLDAGGNVNADYVSKWDGSNWIALGSGFNGNVSAIKVVAGMVYVGGSFTDGGGNANADRIAKWNGTTWVALSTGLNASVSALETDGTNLFVGGSFTTAGGVVNANYIAKWTGSSWAAVGTGLSNYVYSLKYYNGTLYAGGQFINAGGDPNADNIAKWNGTTWSSIGNTPFDYTVNAIEVVDNNTIYAGGCFESPTYYLAKWNGTAWQSMGGGFIQDMNCSSAVLAIKAVNDVVYIGGYFSTVDATANTSGIAKWENNSWSNLGSAVMGSVSALATDGNYLYAGGSFNTAGGKIAQNIARWGILPSITSQPNSLIVCESSSAVFNTLSNGSAPKTFQWKHNGSNIIGATDSTLTINPVNISDQGYYKCTVSNTCGSVTSDSVLLTVNAKPLPVISGNLQFCTGLSTSLTTTVGYSTYSWSNSASTSTISVNTPGSYSVSVSDINGCTNTSAAVTVIENSLPSVSANTNSNSICLNSSTIINAFGANTYSWSPSAGLSSTTGNNVTAFPSSTTIYTITGTAGNGCQNTTSVSISVKVPFSNEIICEVNIDTATNHNFVVWEKTPNVGTAYFKIWKESTFGGIYTAIDSVAFDSMSIYTDMASNASVKSERYKISVVDTCGNESNQSPAHKTLHLTVNLGMGNTINLIWENYEGFVFGSYYIYRGLTPATIVPIDTIQNTITTYTDIAPLVGYNYYKIIIANPDSCVASSNAKTQTTQTFNTSVSNMEEYKILPTGIKDFGFNYGLNAYPNPYSNETNISYSLNTKSKVKLEIYDLLGQRIAEIINENQLAGKYQYSFSAKNIGFAQGVYFVKLLVDEQSFTKKLIETK
ncbi:MAG: T9SS type A sorting domain-containing protein [Bacteroidetes bacterium]|nr:T9SS type A sorting domain-containing protein [Bacteroidota bacterium]